MIELSSYNYFNTKIIGERKKNEEGGGNLDLKATKKRE